MSLRRDCDVTATFFSYIFFHFHRLEPEVIEQLFTLPRVQLLWGCSVIHFNDYHEPFNITYIDGEDKAAIPDSILYRMNKGNGFDAVEVEFPIDLQRCPSNRDHQKQGWISYEIQEINQMRNRLPIRIPPQLKAGNLRAFIDFVRGN